MRISFVASLNGAGHFGRVATIAEQFLELGHSVSLIIGEKHLKLDRERICQFATEDNSQILVLPRPLGLEGPEWGIPSHQSPDRIPPAVKRAIMDADFVVSDNSIWPLKLSKRTVLMAQFLWVDYWRNVSTAMEAHVIDEEIQLCDNVRMLFSSPSFQIKSSFVKESNTFPLRLLTYSRDLLYRNRPTKKEIWFAAGTTGLNVPSERLPHVLPGGFAAVLRETFHLAESSYRPAAVVGRPGLGSIRDALAAGIPFLPLWGGEDYELQHNSNVLFEKNLVWPDWNRKSATGLFSPTLEDDLRKSTECVRAFADADFVSLDDAVKLLVETGERLLSD